MNHISPYRLKEHYEETEGGSVDSKDLYGKFSVSGGDKSQAALGKYIKLLFPSVKNRKIQSNGKNIRAYEGIQEKKSEELHNGMDPAADNFELIRKWLPVPFFVSNNESDHIECGVSSDVVNGHDTLKKIKRGINEIFYQFGNLIYKNKILIQTLSFFYYLCPKHTQTVCVCVLGGVHVLVK